MVYSCQHILLRKPSAVETLASARIINKQYEEILSQGRQIKGFRALTPSPVDSIV
jgi:hypothetical protein